jgi:hypothetical protein
MFGGGNKGKKVDKVKLTLTDTKKIITTDKKKLIVVKKGV